jgi:tRNA (adenine57-N1/adenine58-N1)-methyltransferase
MTIQDGSDVLILLGDKQFVIKIVEGQKFHTHKGYIDCSQLIGKPFGSYFKTSTGHSFVALRPSLRDYVSKFARRTQIIYPKDACSMLLWGDIKPGQRVLEAGTGSGALTAYIAQIVGKDGKVYGYDVNEDSIKITKKNLERLNLLSNVELKVGDVTQGVDLDNIDTVVLDLPTPWLAVKPLKKCLTTDAHFVSFSPTINQVEKTVLALKEANYVRIEAFETILREFDVKPDATRPKTLGITHTGYVVSARNCV